MDPWGNAAAQYNQGLGQLQQINQQGYQAQAQGPASIYDRFLQGYVQAKQMRMQEAQMERENAYKLAQSAHLNAQTGDLFQKRQDAETAAKAQQDYDESFKNSIDEKGNIDQAKLAGELARRGQASFLPKAMKEVLVNDETKAKTLKERAASDKAAREHIASLAAIGLQGDPDGAIRTIKGLAESNPDLYGKHIGVLGMVDPQNPDAKKLALRSLYGQGVEAKDLAPKAEIKEIGGKTSVYNVGNPLLGDVSKTQDLGYNPQSVVGKAQADINAGAIDPATGAQLIKKETTIQPNFASVLLQQSAAPAGGPKEPLADPGEEALARAIAENREKPLTPSMRTPGANRINARAAELAGGSLGGSVGVKSANYFTTGKGADAMRQQEIIQAHADSFLKLADALDNNDLVAANKAANALGVQLGKDKAKNLEIGSHILSQEVGKYLSGGLGTGAERTKMEELLPSFASPTQSRGAVRTLKEFVAGQQNQWRAQRDSAMGNRMPFSGGGTTQADPGGGTAPSQETATRKWKQDPHTKKFGWRVFQNGKWEWE